MPLHLKFLSETLRDICERSAVAEESLGTAAARRLRARLADIRAASDIRHVVVGLPSIGSRGRITFHLSPTHHLVVAPAAPIPRDQDKQIDWAAVDTLEIIEIS